MNRVFGLLFRHFFRTLFSSGSSADAESRLGLGTTLGLVAIPGAMIALTLFPKYSSLVRLFRRQFAFDPDLASLPDKYVFVLVSMTITGIAAVLKWDTLFPNRLDFANLAPLPVHLRSILLAKAAALAAFGGILVAAVNSVSSVLFPAIAMENRGTVSDVARFIAAHVTAVTAAGLYTFAAFLALTGTLMAVLPYPMFRRAKRYVQFFWLAALLVQFFSAASVSPEVDRMARGGSSWASSLPAVWFLGLYCELQAKDGGALNALAGSAVYGVAAVIVFAMVAYTLSYRWFFLKSAEAVDVSVHALRFPDWAYRLFDSTVLRTGLDRACFRFVLKTLVRSDRHTAVVTSVFALGSALAAGGVNFGLSRGDLMLAYLPASLTLVYAVLTGLRIAFGMQAEPSAVWVFQLCADGDADPRSIVQRSMLVLVSPVILATAVVCVAAFGWQAGLLHLVFAGCTALVLIEVLTREFCVIPFTCSWMPGSGNIVLPIALFAAGLSIVGQFMAGVEAHLLRHPAGFVVFVGLMAGALYGVRRTRDAGARILYSDTRGQLDLLRIAE